MGAKRTKAQQKRYLEKQRIRKQKINRVKYLLATLTGSFTEQRFFDAFKNTDLPEWFLEIRKAGKRLDQKGVDAIAFTDCGTFYLQIKSSELRALQFKNKPHRKGIPVVVALKKDTPEYIRYQTFSILEAERSKILSSNNGNSI